MKSDHEKLVAMRKSRDRWQRKAVKARRQCDTDVREYLSTFAAKDNEINRLQATVSGLLDDITPYRNLPGIVCLCGSTRFFDVFFEAGWQFTLDGEIVLSIGVCKHAKDHGGEVLGQDVADRLDELHLRKIDLADRVFVLNVGGYVGSSTRKEVLYAIKHKKPIGWLEPDKIPDDLQVKEVADASH